MSKHPQIHQPPNPDDLRRAPPASPECARFRGLLRDFADGDLAPADRFAVDEHVHVCHVCAVELARAEHEVLRLRRAFATGPRQPKLPPDFSSRVVERLLADETATFPVSSVGSASVTPAPIEPARLKTAARLPAMAPLGLLAVAMLLFVVSGTMALWFSTADGAPEYSARLIVQRAKEAWGPGRRLGLGDGLGEQQLLSVGSGGNATVDWHDASSLTQPAATLEVSANGQVRLKDGSPVLLGGAMRVETNRAVVIPIADGSQVELGIGEYVIAADQVAGLDQYSPDARDPMSNAPQDLRVEVEVLSGQEARIVRAEIGPVLVAAGSVGVYAGGGLVAMHPSGSGPVAGGGSTMRTAPPPVVQTQPTLSAAVYERSGVPSVGTRVLASYVQGNQAVLGGAVTNAYGIATLACANASTNSFAILHTIPERIELGMTAPDAYPLLHDGNAALCASSLVLDAVPPLAGEVRDESGQARVGVRILPCVVDDLLGTLFPLTAAQAVSDTLGRFNAYKLPATLPPHQHLVLVLVHPELSATVVPIPTRGTSAALLPMQPIVMRGLRTVSLMWLPWGTATIWEEVPGLPAGRIAIQRQVTVTGTQTTANISYCDQAWCQYGENHVRHFVTSVNWAGQTELYAEWPPVPTATKWGAMSSLEGTDLLFTAAFRHQKFHVPGPSDGENGRTLIVRDQLARPVAGAQVFATAPTGPRGIAEARFLGFTSSLGALSLGAVGQGDSLFVTDGSGSIARVGDASEGGLELAVPLQPAGAAHIAPSLRPEGSDGSALAVRFEQWGEPLPGMKPAAVRFVCEANGWEASGLAPGFYTVKIAGMTDRFVMVPSGGVVTVQ